ncbi:MAG: conjugal transfer protein TraC, partial [Patescibacteria group bacterium]
MKMPFFRKRAREIPEKIFEEDIIRATDIIAPSSISISPNYLKLGEKFAKSFFIFSYPRELGTSWFSPVVNLDVPMDISFFIHPIETGFILKQLRKKVTEVQSEIMENEKKGLVRDPTLEIAYQDLEALRDRMQTAQERMFKFGLYLTAYSETEKGLRDIENTLRSILDARLIYIKPALYQQKEGFISTSPYGLDRLQIHNTLNTE